MGSVDGPDQAAVLELLLDVDSASRSGAPVLALHGWTPDHRQMMGCLEPVFDRRPGYRRLYPDLPGMGGSPAGSAASSDDLLSAVREFVVTAIGNEPFLLIGESYGGYPGPRTDPGAAVTGSRAGSHLSGRDERGAAGPPP